MGDLNVIDRFMAAFIQYIDSGFGLLGGDVAFLTTVLVGIDITLAGLFWAMGGERGRTSTESDMWQWKVARGGAGRMPPQGFPRSNRLD